MLRLPLALFALVAVIAVAWSLEGAPTPVTAATTQEAVVSMRFNRFTPDVVAVAAGTTVTWINEDYDSGEWHDVIDASGAFISESFAPGGAFSVTFDYPGVYDYYCDLHEGMFGQVIVE